MKKITIIALLVAGILLLTGCNADQKPLSPEEYEAAIQTAIALTQVASSPADSLLSDVDTGSGGEAGSAGRDPLSDASDSSSVEAGAEESGAESSGSSGYETPCYLAEFVSETIPDYTLFAPGEKFKKSWTIRNIGWCNWTDDFYVAFAEGDDLKGPPAKLLTPTGTGKVKPGETVTITLQLTAPKVAGNYMATYKIYTGSGEEITPNGFWVLISVSVATDTSIVFDNVHSCSSGAVFAVGKVKNTGKGKLKSVLIKAVDKETGITLLDWTFANPPFMSSKNGCGYDLSELAPGEKGWVGLNVASFPSGHTIGVSVRMCTDLYGQENCTYGSYSFVNP